MKTNAIVRIVIWSIVILVLTAILLSFLGISPQHSVAARTELKETTVYDHSEGTGSVTGIVTETLNIRKTPSPQAETIGMLEAGASVHVQRTETINSVSWGYIVEPETGWIVMDYVQTENGGTDAANAPAEEQSTGVSAAEIDSISINWVSGDIIIEPADVTEITFSETETSRADRSMRWKTNRNKLTIDFCEDSLLNGFGINFSFTKDLTILVPRDWVCADLELDAASANLEVYDLTIQEVDIDTASGTCLFENCQVDSMDVDTAFGDVTFSGTLNILECDAASANFTGILNNVPNLIEMDSASGDLELTLPEEAGFSVKTDALNAKFISDFETTIRNGRYVHGDGSCRIEMDAMSGIVTIHKASVVEALPVAPEAPAAPDAPTVPDAPTAP